MKKSKLWQNLTEKRKMNQCEYDGHLLPMDAEKQIGGYWLCEGCVARLSKLDFGINRLHVLRRDCQKKLYEGFFDEEKK